MRKTLLLFTTMAVALLLAAGTAWAALPAPTVDSTGTLTGTVTGTLPPDATGVNKAASITATFSEPMSTKSFQILNHSTTNPPSTNSSNTFYLLKGRFIGSATKNPPRFCAPPGTTPSTSSPPCPAPIPATVSYTAAGITATIPLIPPNTAILNPTPTLDANTTYTVVVEGAGDGDKVAVKDTGSTPMAQDKIFSFTTSP